jgi:hypothetical protein
MSSAAGAPPDLKRWRAISAAWRAAAVLKLRALRRALKGKTEWEAIRARVKGLELAAERAQLAELARHAGARVADPTDPRAVLRSVLGNAARGRAARTILAEAAKMRARSTRSRNASTKRLKAAEIFPSRFGLPTARGGRRILPQ